ncbi:MAG: hypothetical protein IPN69_09745 [Acidobacteria bacterium]|nr:hypothetical protein [Acidobacteriota bacterium]
MRVAICFGLLVWLVSCSNTTLVSTENFAPAISPTPTPTERVSEPPLTIVGVYTNVQQNREHQWGYTIEIWRQGDKYFGLMFGDGTPRAIGDGPVARLENAEFNPKTESLRFTTVIRRGLCPEVRFEGKLSNSKLEGTFSPIEEECPKYTAASERILLRKSRQLTSEAEEFGKFRNFAEWNAFADGLLR